MLGGSPERPEASDAARVAVRSDAPTQELLRTVVAAARTVYADAGDTYADVTPDSLAAIFDGVCYEAGYEQAGTCIQGSVIVQVASTKRFFGAAAIAPSDVCLWIKDDGVSATWYGSGTPCTGEAALASSATEFPVEASDAES